MEMGRSRVWRDTQDQQKTIAWFESHNPFAWPNPSLSSLSSGLIAVKGNDISCDDAEMICTEILYKITGKCFTDIVVRKKDTVKTLLHLQKGVPVDGGSVHVSSSNVFNKLILLAETQPEVAKYFKVELTPVPAALFADDMLRKPDKAALGKLLTKDASAADIDINQTQFVLDGGALLHRVSWTKNYTYLEVADHYLQCVIRRYELSVAVACDGYSGRSTKDHDHNRRSSKMAASVSISPDTISYPNRQAFLAKTDNKARLIAYLISYFEVNGIIVRQAESDVHTLIVRVALDFAAAGQNVTVAADDTDVLVLLRYHWHPSMAHVYMKREPRATLNGATISIPVI